MPAWEQSALTISGLGSFEDAMREADTKWLRRAFWRGHADARWSLRPRVFREVPRTDGITAHYIESALLWEFMSRGVARTINPPSHDDRVGWMFLGQHYGLPTRLLDWSFGALVALYFVVEDATSDSLDGCIWALDVQMLNERMVSTRNIIESGQPSVKAMAEAALGGGVAPDQSAFGIAPRENDLRMIVQQSMFTIHRDAADLTELQCSSPILIKFIVPAHSKSAIRGWLAWAGISRATLFPDLDSLARELRGVAASPLAPPTKPATG
jgi:hypothetical protein